MSKLPSLWLRMRCPARHRCGPRAERLGKMPDAGASDFTVTEAKLQEAATEGVRESLTEQAYAAVKQKIINLQFGPGSYLNVGAISELLGIGRTPVHQAVRRLAHEGMIEIMPRKGMIVKPVSLHDVMQIAEVRSVNEPYCVRLAAANAKQKDITALDRILERAGRAAQEGDTEAMMLADRDFHCAISSIAGNRVLADILRNLHERSLRFWFISLHQSTHQKEVDKEHSDILAAIRNHDPDGAEQAMRRHIESFRSTIARSV